MNIYFFNNPLIINNNAWQSLLKVLDINCIIDFMSYKPTADNPPSCNNQVFDSIKEKYCLQSMLPSNFLELSKEERSKKYTEVVNRIFGRMIEKAKKYHEKKSVTKGIYVHYEKERGNILVLSLFQKQQNLIDHCSRYFCGAVINQNICDVGFIDLYKLHFGLRQSEHYDKHYKGFPPYAREGDFQDSDDYREYMRERDSAYNYYHSGNFWHNNYSYDTHKRTKKCEQMDDIFSQLNNECGISEKDVFKEGLYEKIITSRQAYDESEIERILEEENERWQNEMDEMDRQNAEDELRSWDRDYPGWSDGM
jgi:hypothetical protein